MRRHEAIASVAENACFALTNLTAREGASWRSHAHKSWRRCIADHRVAVIRSGGVEAIVAALRRHGAGAVANYACRSLTNVAIEGLPHEVNADANSALTKLCTCAAGACTAIVRSGCVDAVASVLRAGAASAAVTETAVRALSRFMRLGGAGRSSCRHADALTPHCAADCGALVQRGVVDAVIGALRRNESTAVAIPACDFLELAAENGAWAHSPSCACLRSRRAAPCSEQQRADRARWRPGGRYRRAESARVQRYRKLERLRHSVEPSAGRCVLCSPCAAAPCALPDAALRRRRSGVGRAQRRCGGRLRCTAQAPVYRRRGGCGLPSPREAGARMCGQMRCSLRAPVTNSSAAQRTAAP
jgi:hypothetical protein